MTSVSDGRSGSRKVIVAAIVATLFFGIYVLQRVLSYFVSVMTYSSPSNIGPREVGSQLLYLLWHITATALPFVLGVFLCVWLVRPLVSELRLGSIIGRSIVAAVCGAAIVFIVVILWTVITGFDVSAGRVYGWMAGAFDTASSNFGDLISVAFVQGMQVFISGAPLVVLAGVLGWLWLRRQPISASSREQQAEV